MGVYVRSAANAFGCRPDSPYAARSRSTLTAFVQRQNGSSDTTHAALTLGYVTHLNLSPKALLLSTRTAPVTNRRSRQPTISCPYAPMVVLMTCCCVDEVAVAAAETVSTPGAGNPKPPNW